MNEVVERVARASWNARGLLDWDSEEAGPYRSEWCHRMRAAIEAMREPTAKMLAAALPITSGATQADRKLGAAACLLLSGGRNIPHEDEAVNQASALALDYRIMIDAALKEG